MTVEVQPNGIVRSRVNRAVACFYPGSKRIVIVADNADFHSVQSALADLAFHNGIGFTDLIQGANDEN